MPAEGECITMSSMEQVAEQLRGKGLKLTPQRRLIIGILLEDRSHPTVDEVYRKVLEVMPEVSRTTVYNTIREMMSLGAVEEAGRFGAGGIRYETSDEPHNHFLCVNCKSLVDVDIPTPEVDDVEERLPGCVVLQRRLTLYGLCAKCRESLESERAAERLPTVEGLGE